MGYVTSIPRLFFLFEYRIKAFLLGLGLDLPDNLHRGAAAEFNVKKIAYCPCLGALQAFSSTTFIFLSQCLNSFITFGFFVSSPIHHQHHTSASSFHLQFTINIIYQNIDTISIQYCSKTQPLARLKILSLDLSLSIRKKQFSITPLSFG